MYFDKSKTRQGSFLTVITVNQWFPYNLSEGKILLGT